MVSLERPEQQVEVHRLLVRRREPRVRERRVERAVEAVRERRGERLGRHAWRGRGRGAQRGDDLQEEHERLQRDVERRRVCDQEERVDVAFEPIDTVSASLSTLLSLQ